MFPIEYLCVPMVLVSLLLTDWPTAGDQDTSWQMSGGRHRYHVAISDILPYCHIVIWNMIPHVHVSDVLSHATKNHTSHVFTWQFVSYLQMQFDTQNQRYICHCFCQGVSKKNQGSLSLTQTTEDFNILVLTQIKFYQLVLKHLFIMEISQLKGQYLKTFYTFM